MRGHTLMEVSVTLAVVAIVSTLAWPSFAELLAGQRRVATVNSLVAALQHARRAAIVQARPVVVCPGAGRCGDDWGAGWQTFVEPRHWRPGDAPPDGAVLYRDTPPPGIAVSANRRWFRFRPWGKRATNGSLLVCGGGARVVVVAPSGRVRNAAADPARCGR